MTTQLTLSTRASKSEQLLHAVTEVRSFTRAEVESWRHAPSQRPVRRNANFWKVVGEIKQSGGALPGELKFGVVDRVEYLYDGGHRREAFLVTELPTAHAVVCRRWFRDLAEMGEAFDDANGHIASMRPDDHLRALESSLPVLAELRAAAPILGYDVTRRNSVTAPILSTSMVLRCWATSAHETPTLLRGPAPELARALTREEARNLAAFLALTLSAWGRDIEFRPLWGGLNLTLCMWLFRQQVLNPNPGRGVAKLSGSQFLKLLTALGASSAYLEWLPGRILDERQRTPCYRKITSLFNARWRAETEKALKMLKPAWLFYSR